MDWQRDKCATQAVSRFLAAVGGKSVYKARMMDAPPGYTRDFAAVYAAVRDWLEEHPDVRPMFEFANPEVVATGDLGDWLSVLPQLPDLLRFDEQGLALARYVTARVPRGTLLMLVASLEAATEVET